MYQKAIEEERDNVPTLTPLTRENMTSILEIEHPLIVYVAREQKIPPNVRETADKLK